jgi:hypothetical protein|tara:strand:+ start:158 stop:433 length:276 start_codon:yes stop_codon:yes gene_type:complete
MSEPTQNDQVNESQSESESVSDVQPIDVDDEYNIDQYGDDEDDIAPVENILASTLTTPEGDTICSALVNMGYQLEVQNRILVKLLSTLQKK